MSPTLLTQTSGSTDLLKAASGIGWDEIQRSPQTPPFVSNPALWTAISEVAGYGARVAVRPSSESALATSAPGPIAVLARDPASSMSPRLYRVAASSSVSVRAHLRPAPTRARPRSSARGVANLRLTTTQRREVTKLHLQGRNRKAGARVYDRFQLLRQWEGEVVDVEAEHFLGAMITPDPEGRPRRAEMRFPRRLVRRPDQDAVIAGAQFYYCVGRLISKGVSTPGSIIWFRRFPENPEPDTAILGRVQAARRVVWSS